MDFLTFKLIVAFLLLFSVSLLPLILATIIIRRKWRKKLKYALIFPLTSLQVSIFYSVFIALYPPDSFYIEEYKTVIGTPAPPSANVVKKSASYPDFHGSYNSVSLIKLSDLDFTFLRNEINKSKNFGEADLIYTETLNDVLNSDNGIKQITWKERKNAKKDWQHHFIGFLDQQKMVIIYYVNH